MLVVLSLAMLMERAPVFRKQICSRHTHTHRALTNDQSWTEVAAFTCVGALVGVEIVFGFRIDACLSADLT